MEIGFDPAKSAENVRRRGLPFDIVPLLDWASAVVREDLRRDYGEHRMQAFLYGDGRPYVVVYTMRGAVRWIISFRRAHEEERRSYERGA